MPSNVSRCPTQDGIPAVDRNGDYGLAAVGGHRTLPYKNDDGGRKTGGRTDGLLRIASM